MGKRLKSVIAAVLAVSMIALCGCENKNAEEENIPTTEELLASQYDELLTAFPEQSKAEDVIKYVGNWAKKEELSVRVDDKDILVIDVPATGKHDNDSNEVIQCSISNESTETELIHLASVMYIITHLSSHGPVTAIINSRNALEKIAGYCNDKDHFINLDYSEEPLLTNRAAALAEYKLSKNISWKKPRFDKAYKITLSNLRGGRVTDLSEGHANPLLQLNSILAKWNTGGYLYDLAAFRGGISASKYQKSASMTVVVSENDAEKFQSRVEKQINGFEKKYGDKEPDYAFTVEETEVPSRVMDNESASSLVSLLYTMLTGEYSQDEETEEITAYSNIGKLRVTDTSAKVEMQIYSIDRDTFKEMKKAVKTLAEISNFTCSKEMGYRMWTEKEDFPLLQNINEKLECELHTTFGMNECSTVHKYSPDTECISVGVNFDNWSKAAEAVISTLKK